MAKRVLCSLLIAGAFLGVLPRALARNVLHFGRVPAIAAGIDISAHFKKYRILLLTDSLQTLAGGETLTLRVDGGRVHTFVLEDSRLFAPNHVVSIAGPDGVQRTTLAAIGYDGAYFTNAGVAKNNKLVLAQFENQYSISLAQGGEAWEIEPLSAYIKGAPKNLYVQYAAAAVKTVNATCGTHAPVNNFSGSNNTGGPEAGSCKVTELATSCDYSLFQKYGSVAATINRTVTITNLTRADYKISSGLLDEVEFRMVEHYVATCDSCNPWTPTTVINTNLTNIRAIAPTLFLNTYDLCQHWFDHPSFGGGTVGLAYLGAACGPFRYNAVMDYTTNLNSMRCMNSHEIGHNFDCSHDASGSSTIMAPTVSGSTVWSAQSVSEQELFLPTISCLGTCPTSVAPCDTMGVHNLIVRKDSAVGNVVVKWEAAAGYSFQARLYNFSTGAWTAFTTVASPADSIVFAMPATPCAGKYKVDIMPICSGPVYGGRKQVVFDWSRAVPLTASITASQTFPVCAGTPVTYSATTNGTSGVSYQWKLNGGAVGTNSPNYSATAAAGDVVNVVVTLSGGTCYTGTPATSASVTTTTTTSVAPDVSIASTASSTVCPTQSVTFTATPTNGGTSPSYQWKKNGVNVGTNSAIYAAAGWANGDVITVEMTSNATCAVPATDTSNAITMAVITPTTPTITAAAAPASVCAGQSYTLSLSPVISGATYEWFNGSTSVGSGASLALTAPAGAYTHFAIATLPASGCYTSPMVTSNTVTANVTAPTTPTASVSASATTVCAGTPVSFTSATNITGGSYQWQVNGGPAGMNAPAFSYTPANGDVVTLVVAPPAGSCYSPATITSLPVTMTVNPLVASVATLSGDTTMCGSQTHTYTAATTIAPAIWSWTVNGAPVTASGNTYTYAAADGDILAATAASTGTGCYSPGSATATLSMDVATPQAYSIALSTTLAPGPGTGTTVTYNAAVTGVSPYVIRWYNFGTLAFSSTIPTWTHVIPAGGKDSVWAWISPVGQLGCFAADSVRSNVLTVNAEATAIAAATGASGIQVFPNPTHDVLYIRGVKRGDEIRVWNKAGQVVARRVATSSDEEFDVRRWAAGLYVVQVGDVVVRVVRE